MAALNKAQVMGNVGQDPRIAHTKDGTVVAQISVATSSKYKDETYTEWHRVSAFGRRAEIIAEFVKKGDPIFVEGPMRTHKWVDDKGIERYTTEVIANNIQLLASKPKDKDWADSVANGIPPHLKDNGTEAPPLDDIPMDELDDIPY
ncbi:single-stranded DNA-binding protein [Hydromonas duriensis]|uniref:Single-stranded DNA-binding protein n=1 Tax=Hydromonas duriensis TaxID=1527608 RepID=A0A4R6Y4F6_9BURK|nr:single-stranded DNA-binding protein [Hydromonas duriensis]TDR28959.1 single-strand DNA-binding protein [Hydromonas duriensis]